MVTKEILIDQIKKYNYEPTKNPKSILKKFFEEALDTLKNDGVPNEYFAKIKEVPPPPQIKIKENATENTTKNKNPQPQKPPIAKEQIQVQTIPSHTTGCVLTDNGIKNLSSFFAWEKAQKSSRTFDKMNKNYRAVVNEAIRKGWIGIRD